MLIKNARSVQRKATLRTLISRLLLLLTVVQSMILVYLEALHWFQAVPMEEDTEDDYDFRKGKLPSSQQEQASYENRKLFQKYRRQQLQEPDEDYFANLPDTHTTDDSKPLVVIGGSDGSGTRAFTALVAMELGARFVIEDRETMDIHAGMLFDKQGWPALVNSVLESTHSANFKFEDLPLEKQQKIERDMRSFKKFYDGRADITRRRQAIYAKKERKLVDPRFGHALVDIRTTKASAPDINYGFKAPVSMLVLPILQHVYGSIKFIHVVRDGRDVCLSRNMSPVEKFYDVYYGKEKARKQRARAQEIVKGSEIDSRSILAMELWNEWNTQVYEYAQEQAKNNSTTFEYVVVRSEDLISEDPARKFATVQRLAEFIGSDQSMEELCQYSQESQVHDMGASAMHFTQEDGKEFDDFSGHRGFGNRHPGKARYFKDTHFGHGKQIEYKQGKEEFERLLDFAQKKRSLGDPKNDRLQELLGHRGEKDVVPRPEERGHRRRLTLELRNLPPQFGPPRHRGRLMGPPRLKFRRKNKIPVKSRYGKWVAKLEGVPEISKILHEKGAQGLEIFGYEPSLTSVYGDVDEGEQYSVHCNVSGDDESE